MRLFARPFTELFALVLRGASGITLVAYLLQQPREAGTLQLAIAIAAVVLLNAVIGFTQEYTAERTVEALQAMVPPVCRVLRDGERVEVPARDLVVGDVVVLAGGDAVPADSRLVDAAAMAVNNAALTGESGPAGRTVEPARPACRGPEQPPYGGSRGGAPDGTFGPFGVAGCPVHEARPRSGMGIETTTHRKGTIAMAALVPRLFGEFTDWFETDFPLRPAAAA